MTWPRWHPMAVHFPVALVVTAGLLLITARLMRPSHRRAALATVGTWNLCIGAFAALIALGTGMAAVLDLHVDAAAHRAISLHLRWAMFTTLCVVLVAVWRGAGSEHASQPSWLQIAVLSAVTAALVVTAYLGGQNVYEYGIGVH
jgi:uncharacterized membrane protein